jgi:hypothetical protein
MLCFDNPLQKETAFISPSQLMRKTRELLNGGAIPLTDCVFRQLLRLENSIFDPRSPGE